MSQPLAFSYVRFSTPEQARGDSFRRQAAAATKLAAERGWQLSDVPLHDLGKSAFRGGNARDGKLGEFLDAIEAGRVPKGSILIIEALDRLTRENPWDAVSVLSRIIRAGVSIATTMNGRVYGTESAGAGGPSFEMVEIVVLLAQGHEESRKKSERHLANWRNKRDWATGPHRVPMTARIPAWLQVSADGRSFELVQERVEIVRGIFQQYLDGMGTHAIAYELNDKGIKPFGKARFWHRSYVSKVLESRAVLGEFTPHVIQHEGGRKVRVPLTPIAGYFPAVVDAETFSRVSAMRSSKRAPSGRGTRRSVSHVLAGLARCERCGAALVRVNKGARGGALKLVCYRVKSRAGCDAPSIRLDPVEKAVLENLAGIAEIQPDAMEGFDDVEAKRVSQIADAARRQRDHKVKLERQLARFIGALQEDEAEDSDETRQRAETDFPTVAAELRKIERQLQEIAEWEADLGRKLAEHGPTATIHRRKMLAEEASKPEPDIVRLNALLRQLVSRVVVKLDERRIVFHWHGMGITRQLYDPSG